MTPALALAHRLIARAVQTARNAPEERRCAIMIFMAKASSRATTRLLLKHPERYYPRMDANTQQQGPPRSKGASSGRLR